MIDDESLKNIQQLHQLKTEGVITEEDFAKAKEKLLFGSPAKAKASIPSTTTGATVTTPEFNAELQWALLPLRRYADFNGRSSRREFWMFQLVLAAWGAFCAVLIIADTDVLGDMGVLGKFATMMLVLGALGMFIPALAVQVRRLHDQDKSGWLVLLNLIPYVGVLIVLALMLIEGTPGDNRYGADPKLT